MKCAACDAAIAKSARFCAQCGAPAGTAAEPAAAYDERDAIGDDIRAARAFAQEARQRATGRPDLGSSMAKGAAIGAVVGIPVPFVGPIAGAMVGAGVAVINTLTGD